MAEGEDSGEKTLDPTVGRLKKARDEGNVPSSPELQTFARFVGLAVGIAGFAGFLSHRFAESMLRFWDQPHAASSWLLLDDNILTAFGPTAMLVLGVLFLAPVLAVVALIAQQAITFSPKKLAPKLDKISPMKNASNKFGANGWVEFLKGAVKMIVVSIAGILIAIDLFPDMMAAVGAPPALLLGELRAMGLKLLVVAVILAAAAAAIDVPFKWARHRSKLKMSHQEVKEEAKESEGDPEQKGKRREMGRSIAQNRQLLDVPDADVVVVNPTHYAVALKWNRDGGEVPRCVAKGVDHFALEIKRRAEAADVPVYRDVPTARALHASVEVGEEIRRDQYEAVAAAIRFADRLRRAAGAKRGD